MKLWEVIKAIEDGNKNKFVNEDFTLQYSMLENRIFIESHVDYCNFTLPLDGWEEVKPPRQWSEKELTLFKLLPDWAKWIVKEEIGGIFVYEKKPILKEITGSYTSSNRLVRITGFDFLTVTFEESPVYIGDLKGE